MSGVSVRLERRGYREDVTIILSMEGAEYIADVLREYQPKDAGARDIVDAIDRMLIEAED